MTNLLDLFNLARGRKSKRENPMVLSPLIKRLNLPDFSRLSGERLCGAVVMMIQARYGGKRVSARVVAKIAGHYGVDLHGKGIFHRCHRNRNILVVTPACPRRQA